MSEITMDAVSPRVQDFFNKGFSAMERGNLQYAIDMFSACIQAEPGFLRARRFLRAAEIKQYREKTGGRGSHLLSTLTGLPNYIAGMIMLHAKQPAKALQVAEKLMRLDPLNLTFVKLLGHAAEATDYPEIAIQTIAVAREHNPGNADILSWLGRLYMQTHQPKLARECFEELCELRPNDGAALKSLKDAMAVDSMTRDGWAEAAATGGSFRGMMRDEKEAVLLEQEAKAFKTQKDIEALIDETKEKIQREPENMNYRRHLALLYADNMLFDEAIASLEEAQKISAGRDPQVDNMLASVKLRRFEYAVEQLEKAGKSAEAEAIRQKREKFRFDDLADRVARYPNELQLRYELGVLLFLRDDLNEAVQQFQLAQRNPHFRIKAVYYIGVCFKRKKQYDLAIEQLEKAAAEVPVMNDIKKDICYDLGEIYESMGDRAKALTYFKDIYSVDISYKDVAKKIEHGYKT